MKFSRAVAIAAFLIAHTLLGQGPAPTPLGTPAAAPTKEKLAMTPGTPHELTRADLEAVLDGLVASQIENRNIAGAVVGAVKDGQVLLAKGYGYSDYANKTRVTASETLFRPGSISKLFTATAVMQLVEAGKLDLDRDVNDYLDFAFPKTYAEPITLRRLLTHTAGFEETLKNLFVPGARQLRPLREYVIGAMPARIFPPGKVPSYSNYGLSAAGYIVERASGEKFEDYIAKHILAPLKMEHSTFAQPLPAPLAARLSNGYIEATTRPRDFEFVQGAPAGALSATADDMCRIMLAFLNKGSLEGATILKRETVEQMQSRQFELHPDLPGIGLIWLEYTRNNIKAWGHGGDTIYFHSDLWLVPEANFGFFISYNSAAPRPGGGRGEILRALFDRYFPSAGPAHSRVANDESKRDAQDVAGVYIGSRRSETTLLKAAALLGQSSVRANPDGTITVDSEKNLRGVTKKWREIDPLVYEEVDGSDKLAFRRDANGRVTEMLPQEPIYEGQRALWYENKNFIHLLVGGSLAVLLLTALFWPVAALVRRRYHSPLSTDTREAWTFRMSRIICVLELLWLTIFIGIFSRAGSNISLISDALNPWLHLLHVTGWLLVLGVAWMLFTAIRFWRAPFGGLWLRTHTTLIALASLAFIWFAWHAHLLDPSLRF